MSGWWYALIIVALVVIVLVVVLMRRTTARRRGVMDQPTNRPRDFPQERQTARHAQMSEEDRAWEAASRQRADDDASRRDKPPNTP